MKEKINAYFAILVITIAGAGATLLIVRVATADTSIFLSGNEVYYNDSTL